MTASTIGAASGTLGRVPTEFHRRAPRPGQHPRHDEDTGQHPERSCSHECPFSFPPWSALSA